MKRGSIPPTFVFPVIAIGLLVLAFLYYYFPARIAREDALNRQAFRQLGTVADLVQNAVSNYGTALQRWTNASGNIDDKLTGFTDQVPDLHFVGVKPLDDAPPAASPGACSLQSISGSDQVLLRFQCGRQRADIPLETLVLRFIRGDPEENFDEFLVADKNGAVLYQTRRTGLHLRNLSSLLAPPGTDKKPDDKAPPPKPPGGAQYASDVVKVSLGGADYRLYSSPAPIRLQSSDPAPALDLVIYGLISEANVRTRALETPGTVQLTVSLLGAVLIFVAWPLLKFRTMRASERVPRRAALYFFVSSIVTIALLIVLTIHLSYSLSAFDLWSRIGLDQTSDNLQRLAEAIDTNVATEAGQAIDALDQAMTSNYFLDAAREIEEHTALCGLDQPYTVKKPEGNVLTRRDFPVAGYPFFDQMFWVDKNGFQQIKWTVRSRPTPATRLCQFKFFIETMQGHLWQFADGSRKVSFRIDPLYSPNTGEYQAVISRTYEHSSDPPDKPNRPLAITAMVTQMLSLISPVVPPGYGFAIVDESGSVLFHSLPERNGREQLFDEVDGDPALRAAVFARTGGNLVARYHGAPHRFFVRPLRHIMGCPWTLVTFRDLRPLAALQLDRIVLLLVLCAIYLVLVCAFAAIFIRLHDYPRPWLWPQAAFNARYVHTAVSLMALAVLLYAVVLWASLLVSFLASVTAPIAAILIVSWTLRGRELHARVLTLLLSAAIAMTLWRILWIKDLSWWRVGPLLVAACLVLKVCSSGRITDWISKRRLPAFSTSYTAMALSVLLLVPTLPCVCFFRISYDYQENMFTRQTQLETMAALEERVERVLSAYSQVDLTGKPGKVNDVARAMFLRARIDDVRLDRFDTVFVAGTGQEYSPNPRQTAKTGAAAAGEPESHFWPPLQVLASLWGDPYVSGARFLNEPDHESTRWKWTLAGDRHLRMSPHFVRPNENSTTASPQTAALARLAANNPVLLSEDLISELQPLKPGFWEIAMPLVFVGAFMFVLFRSTVSRIFLLHINFDTPWPKTTLDEAIAARRNLILVGLPGVSRSLTLEDHTTGDGPPKTSQVFLIDLADTVPKWLAAEAKGKPAPRREIAEPVVLLDHFEYNCQDAEVNRVKLEILESLLKLNKQLLIVTDIDPKFYLASGPLDDAGSPEGFTPGKFCERWISALDTFDLRTLSTPAGYSNGRHYQRLWAVCSRSERVALYLLAVDGWPNHKNWRALNHLLERGLIERTPVVRIVDPGLRDFIRNVVAQTDVASVWERGESITVWDGLKIAFYVLSVGAVVAVSIYHQQQVLALITTLLGVLPGIGKLFRDGLVGTAGKAAKGGDSA